MGKLTGYFYNHINKKGYFYSHENITSYGIPLLARLSIPHYQKTWKVQWKLGEINVILMLLCLKVNCINLRTKQTKFLRLSSKTPWSSFPNISPLHFTSVCKLLSCYHNGRILIYQYQGVVLRNNDMLFWQFFVNPSAIIRTRSWLLA